LRTRAGWLLVILLGTVIIMLAAFGLGILMALVF
jgi:hypothetical protein